MKSHTPLVLMSALIMGLTALLGVAVVNAGAAIQATSHEQHEHGTPAATPTGDQTKSGCEGAMAKMADADAQLNALVAEMNAATGDAKVAAMAKVLTAIVDQRAAMRKEMMEMHGQMMEHMQQMMSGHEKMMKKPSPESGQP